MVKGSVFKYLVSSERDKLWGLTVDTVGYSHIAPGFDIYPPLVGHPQYYYFDTRQGRILENYQLIYITQGKGHYYTAPGRSLPIVAGDMLIIPPYRWHSYLPDPETGWDEYWIGLRGGNLDERFSNGCLDPEHVVYSIGLREDIIQLYRQGIELAIDESAHYQQALAGVGNMILGKAVYYAGNRHRENSPIVEKMNRARMIMRESCFKGITPEQVAEQLHMSYSWFRKMFREYTHVSPARFLMELKMQKAKNLLLNSPLSIKEVAYAVDYEDASHFVSLFKKYTGYTPARYKTAFSPNRQE